MTVEVSEAADDTPRVEIDRNIACPIRLTAAVSLVAEIVVAYSEFVTGTESLEVVDAVEWSSSTADSGCTELDSGCSHPLCKAASLMLAQEPIPRTSGNAM